jgi:hypothetical protein
MNFPGRQWGEHNSPDPSDQLQALGPLRVVMAANISLEPKAFLIDGFLGRHEQSVWYGPPDSGKSAVLIDAACHIAAGLDYGPEYAKRRVERGAVLYLACKRGAVVKRRVKAWLLELGLDDIPLGIVDGAIDLRSGKIDVGRIIAAAMELRETTTLPVVLVVIDTMNRALSGGDENNPKDMGLLVKSLDRIYRDTGAHVAVVHHCPADRTDRMRGHTLLAAAVDLTVQITKPNGLAVMEVDKANDLVDKPRFEFEFKSVALPVEPETTASVVIPVATGQRAARRAPRLPKAAQTALRALQEAIEEFGEPAPASNHVPPGIKVTTLDRWRQYAYARGISASEESRAKQQAFRRASEHLIGAQIAGVWNELCWKTG